MGYRTAKVDYALSVHGEQAGDKAGTRLKFSDIRSEGSARIVAIEGDPEETQRLQEMGLTVGAVFRVEKIAPFGDPIEISLRGYRLCLRKREAKSICIELIGEPQ